MVIRNPEEVDDDYTKRVEEARGIVRLLRRRGAAGLRRRHRGLPGLRPFLHPQLGGARDQRPADGGLAPRAPDAPARDGAELAAPGAHRRADRAGQSPGLAGRGRPATTDGGDAPEAPLPRPRPVQGHERLPGPRRRRQGADHHRRPDPRLDPARRLRRPPGRRRVRDPLGHHDEHEAEIGASPRTSSSSSPSRSDRGHGDRPLRQHRHRHLHRRRPHGRGAARPGGHRPLRGQAARAQPARRLRRHVCKRRWPSDRTPS